MAGREPVEVTVEIDGREVVAGTLWVREHSYLTSPRGYALDPVLPKAAGVFHTGAIIQKAAGLSRFIPICLARLLGHRLGAGGVTGNRSG